MLFSKSYYNKISYLLKDQWNDCVQNEIYWPFHITGNSQQASITDEEKETMLIVQGLTMLIVFFHFFCL